MKAKDGNAFSMKNNLIQNCYIIGFSLSDFFLLKEKNIHKFNDIFSDPLNVKLTPKIISKFPNISKNYNSIPDELIISHSFPKGLKIYKNPELKSNKIHFEYTLDNIPANYPEEEKSLYSKIYFNCLEFYEPLNQYLALKKDIQSKSPKFKILIEQEKTENITKELEQFYIPKVICFASLLPFTKEMREILINIYHFYISNITLDNNSSNNLLPLEKIIEQLIIKTPLPISSDAQISVSFKINNINNLNTEKINFPVFNIKEAYIKHYQSLSFGECFNFFNSEDILRIFKYMVLEIPLLFFSKDRGALTLFVDNFITLLNPFVYILPHISILPNELYGLINSEQKFIFGINEEFSNKFFEDNNIELDKSIVVICLNNEKGHSKIIEMSQKMELAESLVINEHYKKKENNKNTEESIFYNGNHINKLNIEFPSVAKKKIISSLNSLLSSVKKKSSDLLSSNNLNEQNFDYKIKYIFFKFFIYIMAGYSDYLLNSNYFYSKTNTKNSNCCGNNIRFKNADEDFIREVFNINDFIASHSKDEFLFYQAFFDTKIFFNFFREKIYSNNVLDMVRHEQFDQFIFLKKHKDQRKKKENKGLYENLRKFNIDRDPIEQNNDIIINNDLFFTKPEITEITKGNNIFQILANYGQNIISKTKRSLNIENPNINYYIFPKLLFDDSFFGEKYENLISSHGISNPGGGLLDSLKKKSIVYSDTNTKYRKYMHTEEIISKLKPTNNSMENFEVKYVNYIYFSWFILQGCSLWYCEPVERNIRIDKILDTLSKLENVEEQVLNFLFINIYKYGNKYQFIKLHKINQKFYGYSNYFFLNLLYNKIKEKENKEIKASSKEVNTINEEENIIYDDEEEEKDEDEYSLKRRFLINIKNKLIYDLISKTNKGYSRNKSNEYNNYDYKEEIVYSTEQFCKKCGTVINIIPDDLIKEKLDSNLEVFKYKCEKCNGVENELNIKYHILLSNLKKKDAIVVGEGENKLITPFKFYETIKNYFQKRKNYELNIPNIFKEKELNLPLIIFYFSIINLSFDFLLPYKSEEEKKTNNDKNKEEEFIPIKITYDNDDVYRRFNNLIAVYTSRRKFFRKNNNPIEPFTISGKGQLDNKIINKK